MAQLLRRALIRKARKRPLSFWGNDRDPQFRKKNVVTTQPLVGHFVHLVLVEGGRKRKLLLCHKKSLFPHAIYQDALVRRDQTNFAEQMQKSSPWTNHSHYETWWTKHSCCGSIFLQLVLQRIVSVAEHKFMPNLFRYFFAEHFWKSFIVFLHLCTT